MRTIKPARLTARSSSAAAAALLALLLLSPSSRAAEDEDGYESKFQNLQREICQLADSLESQVLEVDDGAGNKIKSIAGQVGQPGSRLTQAGSTPDTAPNAPTEYSSARSQGQQSVSQWDGSVNDADQSYQKADRSLRDLTAREKLDAIDRKLRELKQVMDEGRTELSGAPSAAPALDPDLMGLRSSAEGGLTRARTESHNDLEALREQQDAWDEFKRKLDGDVRSFHEGTQKSVQDGRTFVNDARGAVGQCSSSQGCGTAGNRVQSGSRLGSGAASKPSVKDVCKQSR